MFYTRFKREIWYVKFLPSGSYLFFACRFCAVFLLCSLPYVFLSQCLFVVEVFVVFSLLKNLQKRLCLLYFWSYYCWAKLLRVLTPMRYLEVKLFSEIFYWGGIFLSVVTTLFSFHRCSTCTLIIWDFQIVLWCSYSFL